MDAYEKLRRILLDDAYCQSDIEVDVELRQAAENVIDLLRHLIEQGKQLEAQLLAAESKEDASRLIGRLNAMAQGCEALETRIVCSAAAGADAAGEEGSES